MKHKEFWNTEQANNYLGSCVIMIGGVPSYVTEVVTSDRGRSGHSIRYIECANPSSARNRSIDALDEDVDLNPVELGMTEYWNGIEFETYFLARRPSRMWKVGITRSNLIVTKPDPSQKSHASDIVRTLLPSKELADTILGKFRSLEEVKTQLKKHRGMLPLSRRFALKHSGEIFYRTLQEPVGDMDKTGITLRKQFKYLDEVLKEDI